jgi:hypothetical protein
MHFGATNLSFRTIDSLRCVLVLAAMHHRGKRAPIYRLLAGRIHPDLMDWNDFFPTSLTAFEMYEFTHTIE